MKLDVLEYTQKSKEEIFDLLKSSESGLSEKEAEERLKIYGPNKLKYFKIDLLEIIKRNVLNYFNLLLLGAGILSFILEGFSIETILIFIFFFIAVFMSVVQDYRANKLAEELLSYFKFYAKVKREGKFKNIESEKLVPGDYIKVEAGNFIPADIRIIKAENALVDESILTGESEPVLKTDETCVADSIYNAKNIGFNGTTLISGYIEGIVIATGSNSYFGKISKSTLEIQKETAYQKTFNQFTKYITLYSIFLVSILFIFNFIKPEPIPLNTLILFSITLMISVIPEFLPGITILTLSISAVKLARKGLIVKRLSSVEDLGGIEVLCTDKTGTITKNQLSLINIVSENKDSFLKYFLIEYFKEGLSDDPYIKAIIEKEKIDELKKEVEKINILEILPFNPNERVKKIIIKEGKEKIVIKGAPENVLNYLNEEKLKENYSKEFREWSQKGYRTLALGILEDKYFTYLGLAIFEDPLKETTKQAIENAKKINLKIKILTGDAKEVAEKVGIELGLCKEGEVILGEEIEKMGREELLKVCEKYNVFARVLPEHKLKIITALQQNYFVGFLGEGINDAPGLKAADVSMVVDTASDITKEEADIILKEKDLNLIVDAIYEGRRSVFNIGKYLKHTMSDNFGNFFSISFLALFLKYVPLTPIQVLLTNLITDLPLGFVAYDNVKDEDIKKPVHISTFEFVMLLISLGFVAAFTNIMTYILVKNLEIEKIRTAIFLMTTLTGIFVMFSIRTKNWFVFSPKIHLALLMSLFLAIFSTILFVFQPDLMKYFGFEALSFDLVYKLIILLILFFIFTEIVKKLFYKIFPDSI